MLIAKKTCASSVQYLWELKHFDNLMKISAVCYLLQKCQKLLQYNLLHTEWLISKFVRSFISPSNWSKFYIVRFAVAPCVNLFFESCWLWKESVVWQLNVTISILWLSSAEWRWRQSEHTDRNVVNHRFFLEPILLKRDLHTVLSQTSPNIS